MESKRQHCKITLYDVVIYGLESKDPSSGVLWVEPHKTIALNEEVFTIFYQRMGNSTAKWSSIKNRMTKSKSGFICLSQGFPPPGYDLLYTHALWTGHPNPNPAPIQHPNPYEFLPSRKNEIGQLPAVQSFPVPSNQSLTQQPVPSVPLVPQPDIFDKIFNSEIIPVVLLKRQPTDVWKNFQFSISHFINEMRSLPNLMMNDYDKTNFKLLLSAETGTDLDVVSTNALSEFGIRFGSWIKIVEKVRDFVSSGARGWFYGKLDGNEAALLLSRYPNDREYFIIRSVPVDDKTIPDLKYVFAISYRKIGGPIAHQRIYKNKMDQLCMIGSGREIQEFYSFHQIIISVLPHSPVGITNTKFSNLSLMPSEKVYVDDISHKIDYVRELAPRSEIQYPTSPGGQSNYSSPGGQNNYSSPGGNN